MWGGPPGPLATPWSPTWFAGGRTWGSGRGPGGPPHIAHHALIR